MKRFACLFVICICFCGFAAAEPQGAIYTESLSITIDPPEAAAAGAQWRIFGQTTWRDSGAVVGVNAGDHVVIFSSVDGWAKPYNKTYTVAADEDKTATVEYGDYPQRWRIVYNNRFSEVEPVIYTDHIYIPAAAGPGALKILPVRGTDGSMDSIDLQVEGSLNILLSHLNMDNVRVTGDLRKAIFRNAHAVDLKAHNLGMLRMMDKAPSHSTSYGEENHISIESGNTVSLYSEPLASELGERNFPDGAPPIDPDLFPCNIHLVGVSLLEFSAAIQNVSLAVSPKTYRWVRESDSHILRDLSLGRIPNTGMDRYAGCFKRIIAHGGLDTRDANSEAIGGKSYYSHNNGAFTTIISRGFSFLYRDLDPLDPEASIFERILLDGSIKVADFRCQSDRLRVIAIRGNLIAEQILSAGEITLLKAKRGRIILAEAISGFYSTYETPHIRTVIGDEGVNAWFVAGFDGGATHAGLMRLVQCLPGYEIVGRAFVERDTINVRGDPTAKGDTFLVITE